MQEEEGKFSSMFLGPKAENRSVLIEVLVEVVLDHILRRIDHGRDEATLLPGRSEAGAAHHRQIGWLRDSLSELLDRLSTSTPWFSPRYLAHMNSDVLIPAIAGYIAAMLYNPNNVVLESSPATSELELEAVSAILALMGFQGAPSETPEASYGWGHVTSGGHVANFEALWVARNLKYFPLALQRKFDPNVNLEVTLASGETRELSAEESAGLAQGEDQWQLLNIPLGEALELRTRMISQMKEAYRAGQLDWLDPSAVREERLLHDREIERRVDDRYVRQSGVSADGLWGMRTGGHPGVIMTTSTAHYSLLKAAELLGIGRKQLISIPVDSSMRMDIRALRRELLRCARERRPVIAVVPVFGTTEEGVFDQLNEVCDLRDEVATNHGLYFPIHVDAAYGGYVRTLFTGADGGPLSLVEARRSFGSPDYPSQDLYEAQRALERVESITIDPHKCGYVPYPAGCILFRDERVRNLISFQAPYLWRNKKDALLGSYTLEGSRPGASVAAVWLAQRVLPLHCEGHGALIRGSIKNARDIYQRLVEKGSFALADGVTVRIIPLSQPEYSIVCFALNPEGNHRLAVMNQLTDHVFDCFSSAVSAPTPHDSFYVSKTELKYSDYGDSIAEFLFERAGIRAEDYDSGNEENILRQPSNRVSVIRMCVMHPWGIIGQRGEESDYIHRFVHALGSCLEGADRMLWGADPPRE